MMARTKRRRVVNNLIQCLVNKQSEEIIFKLFKVHLSLKQYQLIIYDNYDDGRTFLNKQKQTN